MTSAPDDHLERIQAFLDAHGLQAESLGLVAQAFVHRSYAYENQEIPDNERLEFLGDAILGALAAELLYEKYPGEAEGQLTKRKAFLVSRDELGRRSEEMGLDQLVLLGCGEESSGGRRRASIVGSTLEAFIGALHFQVPPDALRRYVREHILEPGLADLKTRSHPDFKSRLQELLQKDGRPVPEYKKASEEGPPHDKRFVVEVYAEGELLGSGEGARIKTAENRAAREAFEALSKKQIHLQD